LSLTRKAPLLLKRAAPRILPYVNDRFVDTAMLSNLGRIPDPPSFDANPGSRPPELWFSPPCDPTCSVAIGVATSGQRLALVTRYRRDQFDAAAAEKFTDLLIARLAPTADATGATTAGDSATSLIHILSVFPARARRLDRVGSASFRPQHQHLGVLSDWAPGIDGGQSEPLGKAGSDPQCLADVDLPASQRGVGWFPIPASRAATTACALSATWSLAKMLEM
ncbi:MAG: hypothetical protein ACRDRM_08130, partial [Pseudonocardiaceae bacterium]